MRVLSNIGTYFIMIGKVFGRFTRWSVMKGLVFKEIDSLIIGSIGIVSFISFCTEEFNLYPIEFNFLLST